jgi:hypothetical protein
MPYQIKSYNSIMQPTLETLEHSSGNGWNIRTPLFPGLAALESNRIKRISAPLVSLSMPALDGAVRRTAENQSLVHEAIIASALERYYLAHASYPATLDSLLPEYLTNLPKETITGKPMHYRLLADGKFLLWSPGWNLKTLEGKPGEYAGEGDIVWNRRLPNESRPKPTSQ